MALLDEEGISQEDKDTFKTFAVICATSVAIGTAAASYAYYMCDTALQTCVSYAGDIGCQVGAFAFFATLTRAPRIHLLLNPAQERVR